MPYRAKFTWFKMLLGLGGNQGGGWGARESYLLPRQSKGQSGNQRTVRRSKGQSVKAKDRQSGKAKTVRQAKSCCQAKQRQSGKAKTVRQAPNRSIDLHPTYAYFAPHRFRIHAPKCFIDMHPKSACMHPRVSAYMHLIPHTY